MQSGNLVCGGNSQSVHSKQGVTPGRITRACPLRPSVPPSTMGLMVDMSGFPSSSYSASQLHKNDCGLRHIFRCWHAGHICDESHYDASFRQSCTRPPFFHCMDVLVPAPSSACLEPVRSILYNATIWVVAFSSLGRPTSLLMP